MKWGASKRDFDLVLAVWPRADRQTGTWWMQELTEQDDGSVKWRDRRIPTDSGNVRLDIHRDWPSAKESATALNVRYAAEINSLNIDPDAKTSLRLKVSKALQSKERLDAEEGLMLAEAKRRNSPMGRPTVTEIELHKESHTYREELAARLQEMPYLRVALVGSGKYLIFCGPNKIWSRPYRASKRGASLAARAEIANGFGLDHAAHWGETKAAIRQILLPRANQLLQLASVQRMLAEALARGEKVLVIGAYVFWYEQDGSVGWLVKSTHSTREADGTTLWKEGTILSTNHGRLVILPYIKDDGEHVRGHTRNAPGDGRAKPRHPSHFVEIPFHRLDSDLMIGLFGELPYE